MRVLEAREVSLGEPWLSDVPPGTSFDGILFAGWTAQCNITGAFLWLYDDVAGKTYQGKTLSAAYAGALDAGLTP